MKPSSLTNTIIFCLAILLFSGDLSAQTKIPVTDHGWAKNSVNTVIFRKNALFTKDSIQYISFYDQEQNLVLGKRKLGSNSWSLKKTQYQGNASDAHNSISLIVDGKGYLHVSWDHHNTSLRYARSVSPGNLQLTKELPMINSEEDIISYPEFYAMPDGDLLFLYRLGGSGNGSLIMNRYDTDKEKWERVQSNLIDGQSERNAYWQVTVDESGVIHISWVWRESPDVSSNHDLCYAKSMDKGKTWSRSNDTAYKLPITAASAEYIAEIPQKSELINQTSMTTDTNGNPIIATYWRTKDSDIPQYHLVYYQDGKWNTRNLDFRTVPFSLSGLGTKAIPISRPQVVSYDKTVFLIFRDAERDNRVSVAYSDLPDCNSWNIKDLTRDGYAFWEPTLDPEVWRKNHTLHLFLQRVNQIDGEGLKNTPPSSISVLEWNPNTKK